MVRNLDCAHIVLDENYNPKLCDFGLITGGIFPNRTIYRCHHVLGCNGYIDLNAYARDKQYVFAFGAILLSLISRRVYNEEDRQSRAPAVDEWAMDEFDAYNDLDSDLKRPKFSLVHQSLAVEPDFDPADGHKITALAIDCAQGFGYERPTMKQVLRSLLKLKAVKNDADFLGVNKVLRSCQNGL